MQDGKTLAYAYTVNSTTNRRQATYPGSRVIREDSDKRHRVTTLANVGSVTLATNTYDLANRLTHRDFDASQTSAYCDWTWDAASRCTSVIHRYVPPAGGDTPSNPNDPLIAGANFGRDNVGNPLWREDVQTASHSEHYWYDAADRLTDFKRGTLNAAKTDITTYTPDANLKQRQQWTTLDAPGNWDVNAVTKAGTTLTETRTNNKANEYLVSTGTGLPTINFAHDDNGNLTDDGTYLYEYNIASQLTRAKRKSDSAVLAEYWYDALGRRVKKVVTNSGSLNGTFLWFWNPEWQLLETRSVVGTTETLQQEFVHAGRGAYIDDHIALYHISSLYYYHQDNQFCTLALSFASATNSPAVERYVTDPYGKAVVYNADWTSARSTSSFGSPFMHQGLPLDGEIGKYQNRHRELLPDLGRFVQRDPAGYRDGANSEEGTHQNRLREYDVRPDPARQVRSLRDYGANLFEYEGANPATYLDPTGETYIYCAGDCGTEITMTGGVRDRGNGAGGCSRIVRRSLRQQLCRALPPCTCARNSCRPNWLLACKKMLFVDLTTSWVDGMCSYSIVGFYRCVCDPRGIEWPSVISGCIETLPGVALQ